MANQPFDVLKMLQGMQKQMASVEDRLSAERVVGTAGGDMVQVELTGNMEVVKVTLDPIVVDPEERSVLEDLITAAIADGMRKVHEVLKRQVGGLGLPPGFPRGG